MQIPLPKPGDITSNSEVMSAFENDIKSRFKDDIVDVSHMSWNICGSLISISTSYITVDGKFHNLIDVDVDGIYDYIDTIISFKNEVVARYGASASNVVERSTRHNIYTMMIPIDIGYCKIYMRDGDVYLNSIKKCRIDQIGSNSAEIFAAIDKTRLLKSKIDAKFTCCAPSVCEHTGEVRWSIGSVFVSTNGIKISVAGEEIKCEIDSLLDQIDKINILLDSVHTRYRTCIQTHSVHGVNICVSVSDQMTVYIDAGYEKFPYDIDKNEFLDRMDSQVLQSASSLVNSQIIDYTYSYSSHQYGQFGLIAGLDNTIEEIRSEIKSNNNNMMNLASSVHFALNALSDVINARIAQK